MDSRPEEPTNPTKVVDNPLPPSVPYASVPLLVGEEYAAPLSCAINSAKDLIACGTETGVLLIYRSFSMQLVRSLKVDESAIYKLIWAPDSQSILAITMGSILWVSLARDTSVTRVVGGEPAYIPGQATKGGSNEYLNVQRNDRSSAVAEPRGDIIEMWSLEDQELSLLSYSISTWLIEVDPSSLHHVKFGSKDFHYRSCFRVIGVELLITVALNYYEATGLKSISFFANRCSGTSSDMHSWAVANEVDYTSVLASAFETTSIPVISDVLAITGHVFVVSTGLKYVIFRRATLFTPYSFAGKIEYTPQMLIKGIGYTGAVVERRFEAHKQTLYTSEEPTIAVTFVTARQKSAMTSATSIDTNISGNTSVDAYEVLRALTSMHRQGEGNSSYFTEFRSFHHFFLFIYAYHASLCRASITCGHSRFYQALTDLTFPSVFSLAATAAREGNAFTKLIGITSFTFSADICDFSSVICDELIASFTLAEIRDNCKDTDEVTKIDVYMTGVFNLADIFRALGDEVIKQAPDLCLLYPNPSLAELLLNYRIISFKTSIDKQWLYVANPRFILTLSTRHNVCEIYEYGENFLISDLVFDMRPLPAVQVEFGYAPYELVMASVGYSPPYTSENTRLLSAGHSKAAIKQANVLYADLASLSRANRITDKNSSRRLRLTPRERPRKKIDRRKRDMSGSVSVSSEGKVFKGNRTARRKSQGSPESGTVGHLATDELSSMTASSTVNPDELEVQEENLAITTSDIDSLQRLLLQVEPQLVFWACREVQDFNSCFPGFETVSTNVLYIEREDELDIDPSSLYPPTALPRAVDVDYRELQYPTRTVKDDELDILSWEDSVPIYHYLRSYTEVHELPIKLIMVFV